MFYAFESLYDGLTRVARHVSDLPKPELFFGIVAPIGANISQFIDNLSKDLHKRGYDPVIVKVTDVFTKIKPFLSDAPNLVEEPARQRYESFIQFGNYLREKFQDDSALAVLTIARIAKNRQKFSDGDAYQGKAYIIHQFKRREEIDLFRSVFGRQFFQFSIYSSRRARVSYLAKKFANSENSADSNEFRSFSERIVQKDYNEKLDQHGQELVKVFHDADAIFNVDTTDIEIERQVNRFIDLLFGANFISPNKTEYGMFAAKAAALRTTDLSRQVGAAIFTEQGEVIAMGSDEVPKAFGGTYWCDDPHDARDFKLEHDSNERRKREIITEIFEILKKKGVSVDEEIRSSVEIKESQFMDALEYGRIVHAEMSAITDAARLGQSTKGAILYCTTFPCHMCAKHIVSSGIKKVIFLEPYPKSLVGDLHQDSIQVEGGDRSKYDRFEAVSFEHFYGVAPRRYRDLFERKSRKHNGDFKRWVVDGKTPNISIKFPIYAEFMKVIVATVESYSNIAPFDPDILEI